MKLFSRAYAKINFFLKICGVLPEGYHRLLMLMQEIDLSDEIIIEVKDKSSNPVITLNSEAGCPLEKDLCYRAARLFYDELSSEKPLYDIEITEIKHVPSQAGLGGGSSDAAAVLKLLQEFYGNPFDYDKLNSMAKCLGADVPFFLTGGSCFCEGIGEVVTPVKSLAGLPLLLVKPEQGVPTGPCFKLSDTRQSAFDEVTYKANMEAVFNQSVLTPIERVRLGAETMVNDLQDPAMELVPVIGDILCEIEKTAPVFSLMSGSGSCVYAVYNNTEELNTAVDYMKSGKYRDCFILGCQTR